VSHCHSLRLVSAATWILDNQKGPAAA